MDRIALDDLKNDREKADVSRKFNWKKEITDVD